MTEKSSAWYSPGVHDGWPLTLFAALIGYATFLFVPQVFGDGDTYLHVAVGQWIMRHGAVPHADPFSYTMQGAPWVAHEWLSELAMALVFTAAGWNGVAILYGAATALAAMMFVRHVARWLDPLSTLVTASLALACVSSTLLARPHILVLPLLEAWAAGLLIARSRSRAPSLFLLPMMTLWANMHGSFLFGFLLIGPFALEALMEAKARWRAVLLEWSVFSVGAMCAGMLTPQGWHGLIFPLQLMGLKYINVISEWQGMNFTTMQPLELALVAVLYVCLTRGVRVSPLRVLLLLGLLHQALRHVRFEMQTGVVGALILAEPLGRAFATIPAAPPVWQAERATPRIVAFLIIAALLACIRIHYPIPLIREDGVTAPVTAIAHVPGALREKPVFNEDAFGSYMIFCGIRPFLDGRMDMYGNEVMKEYLDIMSPSRTLLQKTLRERNIAWAILAPGTPIILVMDTLPGWRRFYSDETAIVYVRSEDKDVSPK